MNNENDIFTAHGVYSWSNCCGCSIEIHNSGDSARLKLNTEPETITEWLEIEFIEDEENPEGDLIPVIDPEGHNVPLNMVMRV